MKLIEKLKDQKKNYIQHFEENSNNIKKIWSGIREIVNIKKEIATNLNDFFVNIGPVLN